MANQVMHYAIPERFGYVGILLPADAEVLGVDSGDLLVLGDPNAEQEKRALYVVGIDDELALNPEDDGRYLGSVDWAPGRAYVFLIFEK